VENRWLLAFAAIQAIGAIFSTLTYFGITSERLMQAAGHSNWWLVVAVFCSIGCIATLFFARHQRTIKENRMMRNYLRRIASGSNSL
jgi:uncharacterized membrane protein YdjX (TVP38/TMEM64 family)